MEPRTLEDGRPPVLAPHSSTVRRQSVQQRIRSAFELTFGERMTVRSLARAVLDPGFRATLIVRAELWSAAHGLRLTARWLRLHNVRAYGIDVEIGASIGPGLRLRHPAGIVIHSGARIGFGAAIQQGVTIGVRSIVAGATGGSPVVGDFAAIGAGACLLGDITIGDGVVIGANAVVLTSLPDGVTAVGQPARIVKSGGEPTRGCDDDARRLQPIRAESGRA